MQRMKSGLLILLLPPLALAGNQWDTMLPGGNMRFQGIVIAESCRVEAGDRQMTVKMGQISSNRFHSAGEDTNPVPFAGAWTQLHTGPTTLHFVAKYRSTGNQVTGGAANAQAWFSLTYQ
ncbi:MAG: fimbrial protein [Klebsiella michiganensis]|nr:fimbrial protein [Klebsiella michiganensis]